jgi:molybdopterin synthase sulfur carrier subunit
MARMNTIRTVVRLHFKDGLTGRDGFSSGARHPLFPKLQRRGGHQMAVNVRIPTPLRKFTNDQSDVEIEGSSVGEVIDNLEASHGGIKEKLVDEEGSIRRFVNIYVNDEDIRFLDGADTQVKDGDCVTIVPAIAGGC